MKKSKTICNYLDTGPRWHPIPYVVRYFWSGPKGLWSRVVHYVGNGLPFGTHPLCLTEQNACVYVWTGCVSVPMMTEWQLLKHLFSNKRACLPLLPQWYPFMHVQSNNPPPPLSVSYSKFMTVIFRNNIIPLMSWYVFGLLLHLL